MRKLRGAFLFAIVLGLLVGCSNSNSTTPEITNGVSNKENNGEIGNGKTVNIYSGPGEEYVYEGSFQHIDAFREFKDWYEVEYSTKKRGYVNKSDLENADTNSMELIVDKLITGPTERKQIVLLNSSYTLTSEVELREAPDDSSDVIGNVDKNTVIKIINMEPVNGSDVLASMDRLLYWQVDTETSKGKVRGYVRSDDLFDYDNPLKGFDEVKKMNAKISYNGKDYYSTDGAWIEGYLNNWHVEDIIKIQERKFDVLGGLAGLIGCPYNPEDILVTKSMDFPVLEKGKKRYHETVVSVDVGNQKLQNKLTALNAITDWVPAFLNGAYSSLDITVELQEYNDERKIVLLIDAPIEYQSDQKYLGKSFELADMLVYDKGVTGNVWGEVDDIIRKAYPELKGEKNYSMSISFADAEACSKNPHGFYMIIDNDLNVYTKMILHSGTRAVIYYDGKPVYDATHDLISLQQLDKQTSEGIIAVLAKNGFSFTTVKSISGEEQHTNAPQIIANDSFAKEYDTLKAFAEEKSYVYGKAFEVPNQLISNDSHQFNDINYDYIPNDCSLGYEICDFDNDDHDELLILGLTDACEPVFNMYEYENGSVFLAASEPATSNSLPTYLDDSSSDSGNYSCFLYGGDHTICFATYSSYNYMMLGIADRIETLRYSNSSFIDHNFNEVVGSGPSSVTYEKRKIFLEGMGAEEVSRAMYGTGYHYIYELIESPLVFAQGDITFTGIVNNGGNSWFNCMMNCPGKESLLGQHKNTSTEDKDNSPYSDGKKWEATEGALLEIKNNSGDTIDTLQFYTSRNEYDRITETRLVFNNLSLNYSDDNVWAYSVKVFVFDANESDHTINILMLFKDNSNQEYSRLFAVDQNNITHIQMPSDNYYRRNFLSLEEISGSGNIFNYLLGNYEVRVDDGEAFRYLFEKQMYYIADTSISFAESNRILGTKKSWDNGYPDDFQEGVAIHLNKDIPYYQDEACTINKGTLKMDSDIVATACNSYGHTFYVEQINGWVNGYELSQHNIDDSSDASTLIMLPFAHE